MKKFQMMMATVLVALMAFAVQSCGSDDKDDLSSSPYEITATFNVQQKGEFSDADIEKMKNSFKEENKDSEYTFLTDQMAESRTQTLVQAYAGYLQQVAKATPTNTAVFTVTITTTNLKTKKLVCKWDVVWDKGSISTKKY